MLRLEKPCQARDNLQQIDFKKLALVGYINFIIDVDNTVVFRNTEIIDASAKKAIFDAREAGYIRQFCLVSNIFSIWGFLGGAERLARIERLAGRLGADGYVCACWPNMKPKPKPFLRAMEIMHSRSINTVVIGDQLLTDIAGGNRLGLYTVLVKPLGSDNLITRFRRHREKAILKRLGL